MNCLYTTDRESVCQIAWQYSIVIMTDVFDVFITFIAFK